MKKFNTPIKKYYGNSSFWLGWDKDTIKPTFSSNVELESYNLYKLASARRAIANFVNIVTNKDIPVRYSTNGESFTDGGCVTIGAKVEDPSDFDVAVGLALHEGSHILLSDFELLKDLPNRLPQDLIDRSIQLNVPAVQTAKHIWNWIEDRRIDHYIYSTSPGYKDYYHAMYNKYFNNKIIDKALKSSEYTNKDLKSYMFRITNFTNPNSDLDSLPNLRKIWDVINLRSISRLTSSQDTFDVTIKVMNIILDNLSVNGNQNEDQKSESTSQNENGDGSSDSDSNDMELGNDDLVGDDSDSNSGMNTQSEMNESKPNNGSNKTELTSGDIKRLLAQIKKQQNFLEGITPKKTITQKDQKSLKVIEESGSNIVTVGKGYSRSLYTNSKGIKGIKAIIVNNMTRSLLESDIFPLSKTIINYSTYTRELLPIYENEIQRGIQIGTVLGRKLQIRSESKTTEYNRQKVGKIDKRMLSTLGFGNENVFKYLETDSYKKANLHISLDASSSMDGDKWRQSLTNIVALCKAVDMIPNLDIQISMRSTTDEGGKRVPYIVIAYDSTVDKFVKVKKLFPYLTANGTTPEGLAFEAMLDKLKPTNRNVDSYFLNISDGEPYFESSDISYGGDPAVEHTSKIVKKIQSKGIKILSYFVDSYQPNEPSDAFKRMYGSDARAIDVTNVSQITKTMNELFLTK